MYTLLLILIPFIVWYLHKKCLNRVVGLGTFYVIRRDNGKKTHPRISIGFMKEISHPWRRGKGVQVRYKTHVLQVGVCKKHDHASEEEGVLTAIGGRFLEASAKEIREW
jgi:hypothetical protein